MTLMDLRNSTALKRAAVGVGAAVLISVFAVASELHWFILRPIALRFGTPVQALVTNKYDWRSGAARGRRVEFNYQYSKDSAPRVLVLMNDEAFDAITANTRVGIHFIPGCPSCIAVDEDYGSAAEQKWAGLLIFVFYGGILAIAAAFGAFKSPGPGTPLVG
jgi:hypothetical protein